ncbi:MAG: hypothetical protein N2C14_04475, partial [Planctomycetales bacterium]
MSLPSIRRFAVGMIVAATVLVSLRTEAAEELGLTQKKPSSGRCVKTARGYMIPYRTTIPGTD